MRRWQAIALGWMILSLGCLPAPFREAGRRGEERTAHSQPPQSIRIWAEHRVTFGETQPQDAARLWEDNLKRLGLKPERAGAVVQCKTPEGDAFSLAFWESKDAAKGTITLAELLWDDPGDAGRGINSLLALERRQREMERRRPEEKAERK